MHQPGQRAGQPAGEADVQLEGRVGVPHHLAERGVGDLLDRLALGGEGGHGGAKLVRRHVEPPLRGGVDGRQVAVLVVVQPGGAGPGPDVGGQVRQARVGVDVLRRVAPAVAPGGQAPQVVVVVVDAEAAELLRVGQLPQAVVGEPQIAPLRDVSPPAAVAVVVDHELHIAEGGHPVPGVVAEVHGVGGGG